MRIASSVCCLLFKGVHFFLSLLLLHLLSLLHSLSMMESLNSLSISLEPQRSLQTSFSSGNGRNTASLFVRPSNDAFSSDIHVLQHDQNIPNSSTTSTLLNNNPSTAIKTTTTPMMMKTATESGKRTMRSARFDLGNETNTRESFAWRDRYSNYGKGDKNGANAGANAGAGAGAGAGDVSGDGGGGGGGGAANMPQRERSDRFNRDRLESDRDKLDAMRERNDLYSQARMRTMRKSPHFKAQSPQISSPKGVMATHVAGHDTMDAFSLGGGGGGETGAKNEHTGPIYTKDQLLHLLLRYPRPNNVSEPTGIRLLTDSFQNPVNLTVMTAKEVENRQSGAWYQRSRSAVKQRQVTGSTKRGDNKENSARDCSEYVALSSNRSAAGHDSTNQPQAEAANNMSNVKDWHPALSMSTTLPYVSKSKWYYKDPQNRTHGPFSAEDMASWYNEKYFDMDLLVQKDIDGHPDNQFVSLGFLFRQGDPAFLDKVPTNLSESTAHNSHFAAHQSSISTRHGFTMLPSGPASQQSRIEELAMLTEPQLVNANAASGSHGWNHLAMPGIQPAPDFQYAMQQQPVGWTAVQAPRSVDYLHGQSSQPPLPPASLHQRQVDEYNVSAGLALDGHPGSSFNSRFVPFRQDSMHVPLPPGPEISFPDRDSHYENRMQFPTVQNVPGAPIHRVDIASQHRFQLQPQSYAGIRPSIEAFEPTNVIGSPKPSHLPQPTLRPALVNEPRVSTWTQGAETSTIMRPAVQGGLMHSDLQQHKISIPSQSHASTATEATSLIDNAATSSLLPAAAPLSQSAPLLPEPQHVPTFHDRKAATVSEPSSQQAEQMHDSLPMTEIKSAPLPQQASLPATMTSSLLAKKPVLTTVKPLSNLTSTTSGYLHTGHSTSSRQPSEPALPAIPIPKTQWVAPQPKVSLRELQEEEEQRMRDAEAAALATEQEQEREQFGKDAASRPQTTAWGARLPVANAPTLREIQEMEAASLAAHQSSSAPAPVANGIPAAAPPPGWSSLLGGSQSPSLPNTLSAPVSATARTVTVVAPIKQSAPVAIRPTATTSVVDRSVEKAAPASSIGVKPSQQALANASSSSQPVTEHAKSEINSKTLQTNDSDNPFGAPAMSDEFKQWCRKHLQDITGNDDITLITFLMTVDTPQQIADYVHAYLGKSDKIEAFISGFIEHRSFNGTAVPKNRAKHVSAQPVQHYHSSGNAGDTKKRRGKRGGK